MDRAPCEPGSAAGANWSSWRSRQCGQAALGDRESGVWAGLHAGLGTGATRESQARYARRRKNACFGQRVRTARPGHLGRCGGRGRRGRSSGRRVGERGARTGSRGRRAGPQAARRGGRGGAGPGADPRQPQARGVPRGGQLRRPGAGLVVHGPGPRPSGSGCRITPGSTCRSSSTSRCGCCGCSPRRTSSRRWSPTTAWASATPRSWSRPGRCCTTSGCRSTAPTTRPTASSSPRARWSGCSTGSTRSRRAAS